MTTYSQPASSSHCSSLTSSLPLRPGAQTFGKCLTNGTALALQTSLQLSSAVPSNKTEAESVYFARTLHCASYVHPGFGKFCLFRSAAEPSGQPGSGSGSSSHGVHRWLSGVWQHPLEPARGHRAACHQRTRTGECTMSYQLTDWSLLPPILSAPSIYLHCSCLTN